MNVYGLLKRRALVTRGSAQAILGAIESAPVVDATTLELDFSGVEAVAPSFVDELIAGLSASSTVKFKQIRVTDPPSRLSEKFRAVGRGRDLIMEEDQSGDWIITLPP